MNLHRIIQDTAGSFSVNFLGVILAADYVAVYIRRISKANKGSGILRLQIITRRVSPLSIFIGIVIVPVVILTCDAAHVNAAILVVIVSVSIPISGILADKEHGDKIYAAGILRGCKRGINGRAAGRVTGGADSRRIDIYNIFQHFESTINIVAPAYVIIPDFVVTVARHVDVENNVSTASQLQRQRLLRFTGLPPAMDIDNCRSRIFSCRSCRNIQRSRQNFTVWSNSTDIFNSDIAKINLQSPSANHTDQAQ